LLESFDPISLPLYAVALYAAAMYPLGVMLGSSCSSCCGCQLCEAGGCCGNEWPRVAGFCCGGVWRTGSGKCCGGERYTEPGTCCNNEWHAADEAGECCDHEWHTDSGTCCKTKTLPLLIVGCGDGAAGSLKWLSDGLSAKLISGGGGYAVSGQVRTAPTITVSGGSGSGLEVSVTLGTVSDECGRPQWRIASVGFTGGTGYRYIPGTPGTPGTPGSGSPPGQGGTSNLGGGTTSGGPYVPPTPAIPAIPAQDKELLTVTAAEGDTTLLTASLTVTSNPRGEPIAVNIVNGGLYYRDTEETQVYSSTPTVGVQLEGGGSGSGLGGGGPTGPQDLGGAEFSATVDVDPDSPTFGQVTGITIENAGDKYTEWVWGFADHWFTSSDDGECCGNRWKTGDGHCCRGTWYPEPVECGAGRSYIELDECCGCFPDQFYDPRTDEMVDTVGNEDIFCTALCNDLGLPFDADGNPLGPKGRCCQGDTCTQEYESVCDEIEGVWLGGCCEPTGCPVPCCSENDDGVSQCEIKNTGECLPPESLANTFATSCDFTCLGACCIDGVEQQSSTQQECDEAGGCWGGAGSTSCRPEGECRPPFTSNCCESTISDASGLTFTQPRRKRCAATTFPWRVTVTGTTDSEVRIHGVSVGLNATPAKRCPINVSFVICWDKFNIEPVECDTTFRRLDVTVCWEPAGEAVEVVNYSGCNDISLWLSDCTRGNCKTTMTYSGPGVTTAINVDVRGDAEIQANGGPLVFSNDFNYAPNGCNRTLTLSGSSTAANTMSTIKQQIPTLTSLVKAGSGRWVLAQANLHGGTNELRHGTLEIGIDTLPSSGALGTSSAALQMTGTGGPVTLLLAATVTFTKWVNVPAEGGAATIGGADDGYSAFSDPNTYVFAGRPLTLRAATGGTIEFRNRWNNTAGDDYPTVDFTIGSNGNAGTVLLTSDLSTTGSVVVAYGTLHVTGAEGQFQFADEVIVSGNDAELRYDSDIDMERPLSLTAGTLSGNATIYTVAATGGTISVDSGDEIEISGTLSGSGTLAKTGAGTLRLAASTFSGTLNISAGEVVLEQIKTNPGGLVSTATFSNTALSVAFTADPETDDEFVLLSGPTTQTYTPTLTGTTKTGAYNASTSTLTID
jgi:hypothetical protein